MPGRNYNDTAFRFGFNNKEKDNEIEGIGNSIDFGSRIHNARLGRFLSPDPLALNFPYDGPYNFTSDNPIIYVDRQGKTKWLFLKIIDERTNTETMIKLPVSDELMHAASYHNSSGGLGSYDVTLTDWYDINLNATIVINKDGKVTSYTQETPARGKYRSTTNFNLGQGYANFSRKAGEILNRIKKFEGVKEGSVEGGLVLYVRERSGNNNEQAKNKSAKSVDGYVDATELLRTIEVSLDANKENEALENVVQMVKLAIDHTNDALSVGGAVGEQINDLREEGKPIQGPYGDTIVQRSSDGHDTVYVQYPKNSAGGVGTGPIITKTKKDFDNQKHESK